MNLDLIKTLAGPFLSVRQVAVRYGVTPRCVRNWCKEGVIKPAYQSGKIWVIAANHSTPGYMENEVIASELGHRVLGKVGRPKGSKNKRKRK